VQCSWWIPTWHLF